ncbi:MAG: DNA ligase (NAD(+)) LigA, partial [Lewinella sp.]|nr:DNA ligase (NAD(+)) LigA [Lewinella sp.]
MYGPTDQKLLFELSKAYLNAQSAERQKAPAAQAEELRRLLVYHEWRYYILNDPVVSDYEYDQLYKQLEALEADDPSLITPDSPTQRVSPDL